MTTVGISSHPEPEPERRGQVSSGPQLIDLLRRALGREPTLERALAQMLPRAERALRQIEEAQAGGTAAVRVPTAMEVRLPEPTAAAAGNTLLALHERYVLAQVLAVTLEPPGLGEPGAELHQRLQTEICAGSHSVQHSVS